VARLEVGQRLAAVLARHDMGDRPEQVGPRPKGFELEAERVEGGGVSIERSLVDGVSSTAAALSSPCTSSLRCASSFS